MKTIINLIMVLCLFFAITSEARSELGCQGELTLHNVNLDGVNINQLSIQYKIGFFFGEPTEYYIMKYSSDDENIEIGNIHFRARIYSQGKAINAYAKFSPLTAAPNEWSWDVTGSPNWDKFLFNQDNFYLSEAEVKSIYRNEFKLGDLEVLTSSIKKTPKSSLINKLHKGRIGQRLSIENEVNILGREDVNNTKSSESKINNLASKKSTHYWDAEFQGWQFKPLDGQSWWNARTYNSSWSEKDSVFYASKIEFHSLNYKGKSYSKAQINIQINKFLANEPFFVENKQVNPGDKFVIVIESNTPIGSKEIELFFKDEDIVNSAEENEKIIAKKLPGKINPFDKPKEDSERIFNSPPLFFRTSDYREPEN